MPEVALKVIKLSFVAKRIFFKAEISKGKFRNVFGLFSLFKLFIKVGVRAITRYNTASPRNVRQTANNKRLMIFLPSKSY